MAFHKTRKISISKTVTPVISNIGEYGKNDDIQMIDPNLFFSPMPDFQTTIQAASAASPASTTITDSTATATTTAKAPTATTTTTPDETTTTTTATAVSIEPMDLSTPHRFNKRSRVKRSRNKNSPNVFKIAKLGADYESEVEGNEDIFNNEAMENPTNDELNVNDEEDAPDLSKMPAERGTPGPSGPARFQMSAQNPNHGVDIEIENENENENENEIANQSLEVNRDENGEGGGGGGDVSNEDDQLVLKNIITVECQKLNGKTFNGTVNYSEAKIKIFQDGLGLDPSLLDCVKITFNKCPVINYKLKSEINVATSIKYQLFTFSRTYHSKKVLDIWVFLCGIFVQNKCLLGTENVISGSSTSLLFLVTIFDLVTIH